MKLLSLLTITIVLTMPLLAQTPAPIPSVAEAQAKQELNEAAHAYREGNFAKARGQIELPNPAQFRWNLPPQDVKFENDTLAGRVSSCSFIIYRKIDTAANLIGAAAFSASIETNGWAAENFQFAFTLYDANRTIIGGWNVSDLIISCVEGEPKVVEVGLIAPLDASLIDNVQYVSYVAGGGHWV